MQGTALVVQCHSRLFNAHRPATLVPQTVQRVDEAVNTILALILSMLTDLQPLPCLLPAAQRVDEEDTTDLIAQLEADAEARQDGDAAAVAGGELGSRAARQVRLKGGRRGAGVTRCPAGAPQGGCCLHRTHAPVCR